MLAAGFWLGRRTARPRNSLGGLGTPVEHATFQTLHTATLAAPPADAGGARFIVQLPLRPPVAPPEPEPEVA